MDLSSVTWRKASRSSNNGGNCVELARVGDTVAIRDSKDPDGPKLLIAPQVLSRLGEVIKHS
ncbi:DUF397 domain-containing protein [Actinomadura luteofluorescens]|uniref:DUF397 domain-containing protein n=1 Tax=Actinomadura luteofluorescens TaxID=46163 RepID=UPI0030CE337D